MDRPRPIHFTIGVVNMLKHNSLFYVKTLAIYGVLLALVHCPSMREEHSNVGLEAIDSPDLVSEIKKGSSKALSLTTPGYPYAKMMNLIEQCRSLEAQFHRDTVSFNFQECDIISIKRLSSDAGKVLEKMRKERGNFSDYISEMRHQTSDQARPRYQVSRTRRSYLTNVGMAIRKERRQKATRYTTQVLNEYIDRMDDMTQRLNALVERVHQEDEAAKAKSESEAKEKMSSVENSLS